MKNWLSIGEFSKATELSMKALRIYEEMGLLLPHSRSESHYRVYTTQQISAAQRIVQYKSMGFSLEQIKWLLQQTDQKSLQEILEMRLLESRRELLAKSQQIQMLESILTSIKIGRELSADERSQIMDNILEVSLNKLKCRGVTDQQARERMSHEVSLYSEQKKQFIYGFRQILDFAKSKNILLGPGRGNSLGSMVLFAEGYSHVNPMNYDLLPELFSATQFIWLDVEYSRYQEIGRMCDELNQQTGVGLIAFRSPMLEILQKIQSKMGPVDFDAFADDDPIILEAAKHGTRGLYWLEWQNNFHAFTDQSLEDQKLNDWDNLELENFYGKNLLKSQMDYLVLTCLQSRNDRENFFAYPTRVLSSHSEILPELISTKGLLIFREDWLKIYSRFTQVKISEADQILKDLVKNQLENKAHYFDKIQNDEVRNLLIERASKLYSKAHTLSDWWFYKRSAILKHLWPDEYLRTLHEWEENHQRAWFDFGYKTRAGEYYLKA